MRVILIPVADRPECALALEAAFGLSRTQEANVVGCHVRAARDDAEPERGARVRRRTPTPAEGGPGLRSEAARALFDARAEAHGFTRARRPRLGATGLALWHEMVGSPERVLAIVGPTADLVVVSRPKRQATGAARAFLLAALLRTGKPVLLLPQRRIGIPGRRVLIAWNQSVEAAAAVTAAVPLLRRADEVTLLTAGPEDRAGPKASYMADYLRHWGIRSSCRRTRGAEPAQEIAKTCDEIAADLLVMGAYSRSRWQQLVFGGVTESMLFATDIPVLTLHR